MQSAVALSIVKYLGATYLCWIGIRALIDAGRSQTAPYAIAPALKRRTLIRAIAEGFPTNTLNPKFSMFYLAAVPQFISVGDSIAASAFLLVSLHSALNVIWFTAMVLLFARLTRVASGGAFQRWLKAVTGAVFIGFGVKLATVGAIG